MSATDEEDDRIEALIADAEWCHDCGVPIGLGRCLGCIAYAAVVAQERDFDEGEQG